MAELNPMSAVYQCGLEGYDEELAKHIGRYVKFKNWKPSMGTVTRDNDFQIVGVQRNFRGKMIWRGVIRDCAPDNWAGQFGTPIDPDDVEFVD